MPLPDDKRRRTGFLAPQKAQDQIEVELIVVKKIIER